jgi:hypothetical protein
MVWDYSADEYVERLITAQADDGKVMPVSGEHARERQSTISGENTAKPQSVGSSTQTTQGSVATQETEGPFSVRDAPLVRMDAINNKLEGIAMRYNHSLGKACMNTWRGGRGIMLCNYPSPVAALCVPNSKAPLNALFCTKASQLRAMCLLFEDRFANQEMEEERKVADKGQHFCKILLLLWIPVLLMLKFESFSIDLFVFS